MNPGIYKPAFFIAALLMAGQLVFAQDTPDSSETTYFDSKAFNKSIKVLDLKLKLNTKHLEVAMSNLDKNLNESFKSLHLDKLGADISASVSDIAGSINVSTGDDEEHTTNSSTSQVQDRIKNYSKSYAVDGNDELVLDNKYGRVTINTWNKNEIKVDVQIKGTAGDDETAQKLIDAISISDNKSGNVVSFRTNFNNGSKSIWNLFNNMNDRHKAEVNYIIYMPSTIALDMRNRYGGVVLPSLSGKVMLDNSYGSLTAKALTNPSNVLNLRYYEASIEEISGAEINLSYGSLKLGTVGRLVSNINYAPVDIGKLVSSGSLNVRYGGGIKINEISKGLKNLDINATYSSVNVNLRGDESFDFDVTVKYGSFNFDENRLKVTSKSPSDDARGFHPTKNYKGYAGNSNSSNKININSTYQSVKLQ